MPRLTFNPGTAEKQVFVLQSGVNYVGRHEDNHVCLPCPSVSRRHCCITVQEGQIVLTDLNSTNGSFVEEEQVTTVSLQPGQHLRLGDAELLLEPASESELPPRKKKPAVRLQLRSDPAPSTAPPP